MRYRYLDNFRRGISVFALFSYGFAVLGFPSVPLARAVETSVTVNNSPIQDYVHPEDQTQPTFEMIPGFKPFTETDYLAHQKLQRCIKSSVTFRRIYIFSRICFSQSYWNLQCSKVIAWFHSAYGFTVQLSLVVLTRNGAVYCLLRIINNIFISSKF